MIMFKKKLDNPVFINIAGYTIKIIFKKADFSYLRKQFIRKFYLHYGKFIAKDEEKKPAYEIIVIQKARIKTIINYKKTDEYMIYCEYINIHSLVTYYYLSMFQFQIILKNILLYLLKNSGFILHASACVYDNHAYIFIGKPNSGKSTTIKLLNKSFRAIADDSIIIKKVNKSFSCYQTPFLEKEYWIKKSPEKFAISKIFFLCKENIFLTKQLLDKNKIANLIIEQVLSGEKMHHASQLKIMLDFVNSFNNFYFLNQYNNHKKLKNYILVSKNKN